MSNFWKIRAATLSLDATDDQLLDSVIAGSWQERLLRLGFTQLQQRMKNSVTYYLRWNKRTIWIYYDLGKPHARLEFVAGELRTACVPYVEPKNIEAVADSARRAIKTPMHPATWLSSAVKKGVPVGHISFQL